MTLNRIAIGAFASLLLLLTAGCGQPFQGNDFSSRGPASAEPGYYGKPTDIADVDAVRVTTKAKFLYRQLTFNPSNPYASSNGLGSVVAAGNAAPIPFAEFHIYNSAGARIQQGETTTNGTVSFKIPKTVGTYTLKVFSRALNDYAKVSVLEDIYNNTPYSISKDFEITDADILAGTKDFTASPILAEANENISQKIEGGAFNIMFDIILANEYIRRNIGKNGTVSAPGVPVANVEEWWVADKVSVYWKAGFNPYTYYGYTTPLSFYSPGERKLFILGGVSGNVRSADTDHFDDSVILHEYGHFLEDVYGNSQSPGGSHTGNFVIDARLAWSEGWANYFQSAVLTGSDANADATCQVTPCEDRIPSIKRYHYYVDTYGYQGSGNTAGINIAFNLTADGRDQSEYDNVYSDLDGTGTFREISISRTLYKSSRSIASEYVTSKFGGGISFKNIWKVFSGEEKDNYTHSIPAPYSLSKIKDYPIPSMGLFNWLLMKNSISSTNWDSILTEERQKKSTEDYAYLLSPGSSCSYTFTTAKEEVTMGPKDPIRHSDQQVNNDFYLYYYDGSAPNVRIDYTPDPSKPLDLDLILYYGAYIYFEDDYWYSGKTSPYIARQSRTTGTTSEQISLSGLPAGIYMLNVKVNAYGKAPSALNGASATYTIKQNGVTLCGAERH